MADFRVERREALPYCAHPATIPVTDRNIRVPEAFRAVDKSLAEIGGVERALPIVRYRCMCADGTLQVEAGWTVSTPVSVVEPEVFDTTLAGRYAVARWEGLYTALEATARALLAWGTKHNLEFNVENSPAGAFWACRYDLHLAEPDFGPDGPYGPVDVCILLRN
jgi:hypothetical protein